MLAHGRVRPSLQRQSRPVRATVWVLCGRIRWTSAFVPRREPRSTPVGRIPRVFLSPSPAQSVAMGFALPNGIDPSIDARYATFENGGLQNEIAHLLADEIVQVMPEIADRASTLVSPLGSRLGWEFADPDVPVVRLWSRFRYSGADGFGPVEYRVGGVLAFTLGDHRDLQTA